MRDKIGTEMCLKFFYKYNKNYCKRNKCLIHYDKRKIYCNLLFKIEFYDKM